jgi:hypothetical protein
MLVYFVAIIISVSQFPGPPPADTPDYLRIDTGP